MVKTLLRMQKPHVKMAIFGLLRIQLAIQDSVTTSMIQESFHLTGVFDKITQECNALTMLGNCTAKISFEMQTHIF
jgi:hypothetical protein